MRGLMHAGIDPVYEAGYGSPGVPAVGDRRRQRRMDERSQPETWAVAAGKEMMLLAASGCESGKAVVGVDLNGRRKWGESKFQRIAAVRRRRPLRLRRHGTPAMGPKDTSIGPPAAGRRQIRPVRHPAGAAVDGARGYT